jgi:hypothetical protein
LQSRLPAGDQERSIRGIAHDAQIPVLLHKRRFIRSEARLEEAAERSGGGVGDFVLTEESGFCPGRTGLDRDLAVGGEECW